MLTGSGEIWHYSFLKRVSALLQDQTKHDGTEKILLLEVLGKLYDRRNF